MFRPSSSNGTRARGVTLNEMLVVFSIIIFMLALLVPGLRRAREQMRRTQCMNNLRQWGLALQMYRDDNMDWLPREGKYLQDGWKSPFAWFNALPPYLGLPSYKDLEGANVAIAALPDLHVWICPAKNLTDAFMSGTGKNQFHYGMNQVLDGVGSPNPSQDTPGFPDSAKTPLLGKRFIHHPNTVVLFDIAENSPAATPRGVATEYYRTFDNKSLGRFHGDYANILTLNGTVTGCNTDDLVENHDMRHGAIRWKNPRFYWGYPPH